MSLFSWFSRKALAPAPRSRPDSGLPQVDATRPLVPGRPHPQRASAPTAPDPATEDITQRKMARHARRELLYNVVREAMVRAGVLSSSYKFKVLSLDPTGRQYLVMMDLAREFGGESARLSDIEVLIAQAAKSRHDLLVTAVYWRLNEHVAVAAHRAAPPLRAATGPAPLATGPAPLAAAVPPAPSPTLQAAPVQPPGALGPPRPVERRRTPRYEPIAEDEVAAFRRALAASRAEHAPAAAGTVVQSGRTMPSAPTPLHVADADEPPQADSRPQELSGTQYGELR